MIERNYYSIRMILAPAVDDVCRFGHHLRRRASDYIKIREVDQNKINFSFNLIVTTVFLRPDLLPSPSSGSSVCSIL
jgi:hypothetical protein